MLGSKPFDGIRFVLLGFDYDAESEVRLKLLSGGGEDVGSGYTARCSHVIVDKCVYDDPTCVAARRDGKILVTALWVHHTYDLGMPVDHATVIYRPLKDLNGIPGAKDLVICLTGYLRQDREDIMIMVNLMGAEFSKPLVASRVTHLICYKFEGEKYELAKKLPKIKLVNHTWLEDCLSSWELLPEDNYAKSGYELEMEVEVKDSEEEENAEGSITKQFSGRNNNVSFANHVENGAVSTPPPAQSIPKVSLTPPAAVGIDSAGESKVLNKGNEAKICDNYVDLAINARSSIDVVNHEHGNQFAEVGVLKKGMEPICPDIVEKSEYPAPSPRKEKMNASNDASCSVGSANKFSDSFVKSSNTTDTMKTSQRLSLRKYLFDETRCFDEQLGKLQDSDSLAFVPKIGLQSESGNMKTPKATSKPREEVMVNVLPSETKKDDTCDNVTAPTNSWPSRSPTARADNIEVTPPERPPDISGDHPGAQNLIKSNEAVMVQKHIPDILTSSPGSMPAKSEDPHNARPSTAGRQKSKSKSIKNAMPGKISDSILNFEAGTPCSDTGKAEAVVKLNPLSSENQNLKSKPGKRKGPGKKITGSNLSSEAPSRDAEFGRPKEPHMFVEESDKQIAKPVREKINNDSVGTRVKSIAKAIRKKSSHTVTKRASAEASTGEEKGNTLDKFPKVSNNKIFSSADDSINLERVDSFGFIKDFDGPCQPGCDEIEDPGRKNGFEANTTRAVIEDTEIKGDLQLGDNYGRNNVDLTLSFPGAGQGNVNGIKNSQENESDRGAMKINAKSDKRRSGPKNRRKSSKKTKATAGAKKMGHDSSNKVTVVNRDQTEAETKNERTLRTPNSDAEKDNIDANRLKNVLESEKQNRPQLDHAEDANINEKILRPPNSNTLTLAVDSHILKHIPEYENENRPLPDAPKNNSFTREHALNTTTRSENTSVSGKRKVNVMKTYSANKVTGQKFAKNELKFFLLSGHRSQRNELKKIVRQLKGRLCRDSHHWSYQATHFIVPKPVRTEKFFAAAASGRWILKPDFLTDSLKAGKFLDEEPYEWYNDNPNKVDKVDLLAPRKWRILRQQTGHGAFHGMHIIVYGDFFCPPLDTLKRVVKAGDGIILATAPPYTRFLNSQIDFAIISQGMPKVDVWVQEFLKHEIPCVAIDYLVDFVCKPGSPSLKEHVMFETHSFEEKSFMNMLMRSEEIIAGFSVNEEEDLKCNVCGSGERGEWILICGDEEGSVGCGIGTHLDCCDPPLTEIPEDDWLCSKCIISRSTGIKKSKFHKKKEAYSVKGR